jgi:hypothetical protein
MSADFYDPVSFNRARQESGDDLFDGSVEIVLQEQPALVRGAKSEDRAGLIATVSGDRAKVRIVGHRHRAMSAGIAAANQVMNILPAHPHSFDQVKGRRQRG